MFLYQKLNCIQACSYTSWWDKYWICKDWEVLILILKEGCMCLPMERRVAVDVFLFLIIGKYNYFLSEFSCFHAFQLKLWKKKTVFSLSCFVHWGKNGHWIKQVIYSKKLVIFNPFPFVLIWLLFESVSLLVTHYKSPLLTARWALNEFFCKE